jgi:hypothetical protein
MSRCARGPRRTRLTFIATSIRLRSCGTFGRQRISIVSPSSPSVFLSLPKPSLPPSRSPRVPRCHVRALAGLLAPSESCSSPTDDNRV